VAAAPATDTALWTAVERLLERATVDGIRLHKLGAVAGRFRRLRGEAVPPALAADERGSAVALLLAPRVLERIRSLVDGPLVLIKGPEVARLYPGRARVFGDVDLLTPDPWAVQRALLDAGCAEVGDFFEDAHHLRPLKWPDLGLKVEVHKRPSWPKRIPPPPFEELLEAATPAACGVDGVLAVDPTQHALILAAHGWKENALGTLRDLVDVAAVATALPERDLERAASAWGLERVWHATRMTTDALLEGRPLPLPMRVWARHLESVRERTVLESHLRNWLQGFSKSPPRVALLDLRDALRRELRPKPGESWRRKLTRAADAARHPRRPSFHDEARRVR
jgi:hypothetical protein